MTGKPSGLSRRRKTVKFQKPIDKSSGTTLVSQNSDPNGLSDRIERLEQLVGSGSLGLYLDYVSSDEESVRQKGRPTLPESHLIGRRNDFEAVIGEWWAVLGLHLEVVQKKRDLKYLRSAFDGSIPDLQQNLFKPFLRTPSHQMNATSVRETLKARENSLTKTRLAESDREAAFWKVQQAVAALREVDPLFGKALDDYLYAKSEENNGVSKPPGWKLPNDPVEDVIAEQSMNPIKNPTQERGYPKAIRWELGNRGKELKRLNQRLEIARTELRDADELAEDCVASYSQVELLKFLTNKRYDLNPNNVASAIAGLPHMGCRQSYERCQRNSLGSVPHIHFRVFQVIERGCRRSTRRRGLIDSIDESIKELSKSDAHLSDLFGRRRHDLKRAIGESIRQNVVGRSLPYEITKRFVALLYRPKTQVDLLIAEQD